MTVEFSQRLLVLHHSGDASQPPAYVIHPALPWDVGLTFVAPGSPRMWQIRFELDGRPAIRSDTVDILPGETIHRAAKRVLRRLVSRVLDAKWRRYEYVWASDIIVLNPPTGFKLAKVSPW